MLWKQLNPAYRKLLRSGQRGRAIVVEAKADRGGGSNVGPGIYGWYVTIRVKLPSGEAAEHERYVEAGLVPDMELSPGSFLPVRFDPDKPSRVEIDTAALHQAVEQVSALEHAADDERVRRAERELPPLGLDS